MKKDIIVAILILIPLTIGIGDSAAQKPIDAVTIPIDSLTTYANAAESLKVIDGILIECANQSNYPHNDGVMEEGNK